MTIKITVINKKVDSSEIRNFKDLNEILAFIGEESKISNVVYDQQQNKIRITDLETKEENEVKEKPKDLSEFAKLMSPTITVKKKK